MENAVGKHTQFSLYCQGPLSSTLYSINVHLILTPAKAQLQKYSKKLAKKTGSLADDFDSADSVANFQTMIDPTEPWQSRVEAGLNFASAIIQMLPSPFGSIGKGNKRFAEIRCNF